MHITTAFLALARLALSQDSLALGYNRYPDEIPSTIPMNKTITFGGNYAVLNLDLINGLVAPIASDPAGKAFIDCTARWISAVHNHDPPPISIFTRIYFLNAMRPEVQPESGFANASAPFGTAQANETQLYPAFDVNEAQGDLVLQKTRYYAGTSNVLEEVLRAQSIDTVILSGIQSSGVILSTAYRLVDLDYNV